MKFQVKGSENYAARIVKIKNLIQLPGMNTLAATNILGNQVLVSKNTEIGTLGVFFPIETMIDTHFLSNNNLFKHSEKNVDTSKKGFFEDNQRVRCVSFAGHKSEGFFIPIECLKHLGDYSNAEEGITFDTIDGRMVCKKFKVEFKPREHTGMPEGKRLRKAKKIIEKFDKMIDGQFKFHADMYSVA